MERPLLEAVSDNEMDSHNKLEYRYKATCLDKMTYGWVNSLIRYSSHSAISQDVLEDLSVE